MSRGSVFGNWGSAGTMSPMGFAAEVIATSGTDSAAWAQQLHVTQVGGQLLS